MTTLDHLKLVNREPRELARLRSMVRAGCLVEFRVEHEADGRCCRREPWRRTFAVLVEAMEPPRPVVGLNVAEVG